MQSPVPGMAFPWGLITGPLLLLLYHWPIIIVTVRFLHLSDPVKCSRESCKDYFTSLSVPLHFPTLSSV